jgi:hypothetical protein
MVMAEIGDTTMGAILVTSVTGLVGCIIALWFYIRALHKKIEDLSELRVQEANEHNDASRELERESIQMVNEATGAIKELKRKVCETSERDRESIGDLKEEIEKFKTEISKSLNCRECPARAQMR